MPIHTQPSRGQTDSWITPKFIVDELGPFDLDPCACIPQPWPCATQSYTYKDNGLVRPWFGRVWLNPPYGDQTWKWMQRLSVHGNGIALIFARVETSGFFEYVWGRLMLSFSLRAVSTFHRQMDHALGGILAVPLCWLPTGSKMQRC